MIRRRCALAFACAFGTLAWWLGEWWTTRDDRWHEGEMAWGAGVNGGHVVGGGVNDGRVADGRVNGARLLGSRIPMTGMDGWRRRTDMGPGSVGRTDGTRARPPVTNAV